MRCAHDRIMGSIGAPYHNIGFSSLCETCQLYVEPGCLNMRNLAALCGSRLLYVYIYIFFFELGDFIMINRQKHNTKYLHDKLETKDIRCI